MLSNVDLNRFELNILDYVYRHPITPPQVAIEKNEVDLGCGMIAVRSMARIGLITVANGADNKRFLTITTMGVKTLEQCGLLRPNKAM